MYPQFEKALSIKDAFTVLEDNFPEETGKIKNMIDSPQTRFLIKAMAARYDSLGEVFEKTAKTTGFKDRSELYLLGCMAELESFIHEICQVIGMEPPVLRQP
jgi:hypothetical protein